MVGGRGEGFAGCRVIGQSALVPREIARVTLGPHHRPTGNTRHYFGLPDDPKRVEAPVPKVLRIVQYEDQWGFYLFYCNAAGVEFTDTLHETAAAAKEQAEFEFNVLPDEWEVP
jgi:hypothetical protein